MPNTQTDLSAEEFRTRLDTLAQIDEMEAARRKSQQPENNKPLGDNALPAAGAAIAIGAAILAGLAFWPIAAIGAIAFGGMKLLGSGKDALSQTRKGQTYPDLDSLRRQAMRGESTSQAKARAAEAEEVESERGVASEGAKQRETGLKYNRRLKAAVDGPNTFAELLIDTLEHNGIKVSQDGQVAGGVLKNSDAKKAIVKQFGRVDFKNTPPDAIDALLKACFNEVNNTHDKLTTVSANTLDQVCSGVVDRYVERQRTSKDGERKSEREPISVDMGEYFEGADNIWGPGVRRGQVPLNAGGQARYVEPPHIPPQQGYTLQGSGGIPEHDVTGSGGFHGGRDEDEEMVSVRQPLPGSKSVRNAAGQHGSGGIPLTQNQALKDAKQQQGRASVVSPLSRGEA